MYVCIYIYMINLKKNYARCTEAAGLEAGLGALQPWRQCHANFTRVEIQLTGKNKHPLHYSKEAAQLARAVRVWSASLARGISCISNACVAVRQSDCIVQTRNTVCNRDALFHAKLQHHLQKDPRNWPAARPTGQGLPLKTQCTWKQSGGTWDHTRQTLWYTFVKTI